MTWRVSATTILVAFGLWANATKADDTADEAELHFEIGAKAYQQSDYEKALEHFLLSNRLVSNRNVIYNIARCFEQLGRFPEAFRYFDWALAAETDPGAIETIKLALERIASKVTVLTVETDPPGATLYVERKDLGPRGIAPRRLGLPAGRYTIIAELPGYYPARITTNALSIGQEQTIRLSLSPVLGKIRVIGEPGTLVVVDKPEETKRCITPCEFAVSPGRHVVNWSRPAYEPGELSVDVSADRPVTIEPQLKRQNGSIVISTDEPNALVEIDGKSQGFTPTVVNVPFGEHRVRISLVGYKPVERVVTVVSEQQQKLDLRLVSAEQVQGAARRVESVDDTSSSVSIVSRQELVSFAYPTVAEAIRGLPGAYFTDDRGYVGIGIRGLGRLNSYGNRVLVMLDGVPMNDNWLGSAYVSHDLMTDLGDVERIEVIRGPGSAVYGTGAFSGVINIITRRTSETGFEVGASTGVDGLARGRARANVRLGNKTDLFASAALGRSEGRDYYFPEYREVSTRHQGDEPGWARGMDGMRSATIQGQLNHGLFSLHGLWHRYRKELPNAPFETWFGDPRAEQTDSRGFIELAATPRLSTNTMSTSRLILNRYTFHGDYPRPVVMDNVTNLPSEGLELDEYRGHWINIEQRFVHDFSEYWQLTVGGEGVYHFDVKQTARDAGGYFLGNRGDEQHRYGLVAVYGILDAKLSSRWRLSLGGRVDYYTTFGTSFNPRIGTVVKPYGAGNTKLSVGRAFRAPSVYELYYNDGGITQISNPNLKPETMVSVEVEHSHRFSPTVVATGAVYVNAVRGLIDTRGEGSKGQPMQYVSMRNPFAANGLELGLRRDWRSGWMASLYYGYSRIEVLSDGRLSTFLKAEKVEDVRHVANAPVHAATIKGVAPFLFRGLNLATKMTLEDRRWDRNEFIDDKTQRRTNAAVLWDLVLNAMDERQRLRCAIGVYNVFDWRYRYPVGRSYSPITTMPNAGRSLLLTVEARL